jgi:hypothetical protein
MFPRVEPLQQILGKTITGIVGREGGRGGPQRQLMLVFSDETFVEIYGIDFNIARELVSGDLEAAKKYAARPGGSMEVIAFPDENE